MNGDEVDLNRAMLFPRCGTCNRWKTIQGRRATNTVLMCPHCDKSAIMQIGLTLGADARKARELGQPLPGFGWPDQDKL